MSQEISAGDSLLAKHLKSKCAQLVQGCGRTCQHRVHLLCCLEHIRGMVHWKEMPRNVWNVQSSTLSNFKWSSLTCGDWRARWNFHNWTCIVCRWMFKSLCMFMCARICFCTYLTIQLENWIHVLLQWLLLTGSSQNQNKQEKNSNQSRWILPVSILHWLMIGNTVSKS